MDAYHLLLSGVRLIGWVLVHFLWQAALVALAYLIVRALLPRGEWRYRLGLGALVVLAACPVFTGWWLLDRSVTTNQAAIDTAKLTVPMSSATAGAGWTWQSGLDALLPWLVLAWSLGVLLLSLRAWQQWRRLNAMICKAERAPLWQARLNLIARRFGLRRRVAVLRSKLVISPILVGWIRPVILLPMAVACDFPVTQVEFILAHELAHLKRLDPVLNLFQVVLETLHFYHPAVLWISRDVRNEREICCDQLALSITGGSRHEFAATLAELGELRERPESLLLAANGGVLLDRVQYIVLPEHRVRKRTPTRLVALMLGTALIALTLRLEWSQVRQQETLTEVSLLLPSTIAPLQIAMRSPLTEALHITVAAFMPRVLPLRTLPVVRDRNVPAAHALAPPMPLAVIAPSRPVALITAPAVAPEVAPRAPSSPLPWVDAKTAPISMLATSMTPIRIRHPIYPQTALARGVEGQVEIEFGLAGDGSLRDLRVVRSVPAGIFDQAALRAMRAWKYPIPSAAAMQKQYRQTLKFVLNGADAGARAPSRTRGAGEEIQARADCQVRTGTHICRWPDDDAGS